jgi:hypothetical protein
MHIALCNPKLFPYPHDSPLSSAARFASEVRKPILAMPLTKSLPPLYTLRLAISFPQPMSPMMSRRRYINAVQRALAQSTRRTTALLSHQIRFSEPQSHCVPGVRRILHCLCERIVAGLLDAVEPFLGGVFRAVGVRGCRFWVFEYVLFVSLQYTLVRKRSAMERGNLGRTVSTSQAVSPLPSTKLLHAHPGASKFTSSFSFLSFVPAAHIRTRALLVIMTSLLRFFTVLPPKKRENFFGCSAGSSLPPTAWPAGCCVTNMFPSFNILSSRFVRTGDQSMSSCEGGGSSVMRRGFGRACGCWELAAATAAACAAGVEGPGAVLLAFVIRVEGYSYH